MAEGTGLDLCVTRTSADATLIKVAGEIDLKSAGELRALLLGSLDEGSVTVDLADVEFCDSTGLHTLAEARAAARHRGRRFLLAHLSGAVERVLELAGARHVFEISEDPTARRDHGRGRSVTD